MLVQCSKSIITLMPLVHTRISVLADLIVFALLLIWEIFWPNDLVWYCLVVTGEFLALLFIMLNEVCQQKLARSGLS